MAAQGEESHATTIESSGDLAEAAAASVATRTMTRTTTTNTTVNCSSICRFAKAKDAAGIRNFCRTLFGLCDIDSPICDSDPKAPVLNYALRRVQPLPLEVLKALLDCNANTNVMSSSTENGGAQNWTALSIATLYQRSLSGPQIAQLLLDFKADVNTRTSNGKTPLIRASFACSGNNMTNLEKTSKAMKVSGAYWSFKACSAGGWSGSDTTAQLLKILIGHKADINAVDRDNITALQRSLWDQNPAVVRNLCSPEIVNIRGMASLGYTAIELALTMRSGGIDDEIIKSLCQCQADVNLTSALEGRLSSLATAIVAGGAGVQALIDCGANLSATTQDGQSMLRLAMDAGRREAAVLLLAAGAPAEVGLTPEWLNAGVRAAMLENRTGVVVSMLRSRIDLNALQQPRLASFAGIIMAPPEGYQTGWAVVAGLTGKADFTFDNGVTRSFGYQYGPLASYVKVPIDGGCLRTLLWGPVLFVITNTSWQMSISGARQEKYSSSWGATNLSAQEGWCITGLTGFSFDVPTLALQNVGIMQVPFEETTTLSVIKQKAKLMRNVPLLTALLSRGVQVEVPDEVLSNVIESVLLARSWNTLRQLLSGRVCSEIEATAILLAALAGGQSDIVFEALRRGADVFATDAMGWACNGWTSVMLAIEHGFTDPAFLLNLGVDVNAVSSEGLTALALAVGKSNVTMIDKILIKKPRDLEVHSKEGMSVLAFFVDQGELDGVKSLLLLPDVNVNAALPGGKTAISFARTTEMVHELVDKGASVNIKESGGSTPLLRTVERDDFTAFQALLTRHAEVPEFSLIEKPKFLKWLENRTSFTPLQWSVVACDAYGASVNIANFSLSSDEGKWAYSFARDSKDNCPGVFLFLEALKQSRDDAAEANRWMNQIVQRNAAEKVARGQRDLVVGAAAVVFSAGSETLQVFFLYINTITNQRLANRCLILCVGLVGGGAVWLTNRHSNPEMPDLSVLGIASASLAAVQMLPALVAFRGGCFRDMLVKWKRRGDERTERLWFHMECAAHVVMGAILLLAEVFLSEPDGLVILIGVVCSCLAMLSSFSVSSHLTTAMARGACGIAASYAMARGQTASPAPMLVIATWFLNALIFLPRALAPCHHRMESVLSPFLVGVPCSRCGGTLASTAAGDTLEQCSKCKTQKPSSECIACSQCHATYCKACVETLPRGRFTGAAFIMADGAIAASGLEAALGISPHDIPRDDDECLQAVKREVRESGDVDAIQNFEYILNGGRFPTAVQHSLDIGIYHGGSIGKDDFDAGHASMPLDVWMQLDKVKLARLSKVELAVVRFYSSSSFWRLTQPMRALLENTAEGGVAAKVEKRDPGTSIQRLLASVIRQLFRPHMPRPSSTPQSEQMIELVSMVTRGEELAGCASVSVATSYPSLEVEESCREVSLLYTGAGVESTNSMLSAVPSSAIEESTSKTKHPWPLTVYFLDRAIKKLRAVGAKEDAQAFAKRTVLWRGMKNLSVDVNLFQQVGGTELAPMSTTTDEDVAKKYAASRVPLVFKYDVVGLRRGVPIKWLSLYPREVEYLYPPLTYMSYRRHYEDDGQVVVVVEPAMS